MTLRGRKFINGAMTVVCGCALLIALVPLASVLWLVISRGLAGLSFDFFTQLPKPIGEPGGGVGNAILGTLLIVALGSAIGIPLGVGAGVFLAEKGDGALGRVVRFVAEVLSGVPSIVVGIVAYGLVVLPMRHYSAWAGAVALAVLMVPSLARGTEELVRLRTHLAACQEALRSDRAVGKQLGFLAQELLREVNTIGSKANDAAITQTVIAMKGELEKFREQLDNLE